MPLYSSSLLVLHDTSMGYKLITIQDLPKHYSSSVSKKAAGLLKTHHSHKI